MLFGGISILFSCTPHLFTSETMEHLDRARRCHTACGGSLWTIRISEGIEESMCRQCFLWQCRSDHVTTSHFFLLKRGRRYVPKKFEVRRVMLYAAHLLGLSLRNLMALKVSDDRLSGWLQRPAWDPVCLDPPARGHHAGFICRGSLLPYGSCQREARVLHWNAFWDSTHDFFIKVIFPLGDTFARQGFEIRVFPHLDELPKAIEPHLPVCQLYCWQFGPNK